ncbi:TetR/AcrR family transcriptional regulator [Streptomyces verrucosisporus]|uniref:ScbR family autoregulator-binding transcription factor n=1 Tax=Streptomyces verrucosisporus TaxID=1695161 RepID=UPI0019D1BF20|nr:ScbR family autoregulator-binding transcription factor [Streptomyces verrucosisporus]MBN3932082.1 TetR/AcrR family transcriptional regulator [Streptomyces verrucosisporus]
MARQERAAYTRRNILEAAAELFNEFGYDATTIGGVIERARITRGGLYFHFTSKEHLARGVLDEAVTMEGLSPQAFKLQEWVDLALLLAHRLPKEPILSASLRLSVDIRARALFGTRWPDWIDVSGGLLTEARERGELLVHADPPEIARLTVGAWTGIQLVTETLPDRTLSEEVSCFLGVLLPSIAVPGVLAKLDMSPHRAESLLRTRESAVSPSPSGDVRLS